MRPSVIETERRRVDHDLVWHENCPVTSIRFQPFFPEIFERKLGIKEGETTPDRDLSIERVACVGCCALAPVAIVDETVQAHMAPSRVEGLLLGFEIDRDREEREKTEGRSNE